MIGRLDSTWDTKRPTKREMCKTDKNCTSYYELSTDDEVIELAETDFSDEYEETLREHLIETIKNFW